MEPSMKFILISGHPGQLQALKKRFNNRFSGDAEVMTAESVEFALPIIKEEPPTVIIVTDHAGDMTGLECYKKIRQDPLLDLVPIVLLDTSSVEQPGFSPIDRVLGSGATPVDVLRATFELMTSIGTYSDNREMSRETQPKRLRDNSVKAEGTLEVLTLFDLTVSLGQSKQTGKLHVELGEHKAFLVMDKGEVVGASFANLKDEQALIQIFNEAQSSPAAPFYFESLESEKLPEDMQGIDMSLNELLLKVAVELDHAREEAV